MKKFIHLFFISALCILFAALASCSSEDEPTPVYDRDTLVLIYAIAANNGLQDALRSDKQEIINAASQLNLNNNIVLVYQVDNSNECVLQRLVKDQRTAKYDYVTVTTFPELPLSTSPERISEVMEYVNTYYGDYNRKGLVLWSHGTGWIPSENGSTPTADSKKRTFGRDRYEGIDYETNINELADAIPAGVFDYIWFDCCYMANIETVFQLRHKTDYIVGYTEEIASYGMPYDLTMPFLLRKEPDLQGAAYALYLYYDYLRYSVPVSIVDTQYLDELADAAKRIFSEGIPPGSLSGIQNYTRSWLTAKGIYYYDMGQLLESYTNVSPDLIDSFKEALGKAVIYKIFSDYTWPGPVIKAAHFSGLSMHHYLDRDTPDENFYSRLDWYKATR